MAARCQPLPLTEMDISILHLMQPLQYRESLETSLEISSLLSPDLRKQIAILRKTCHLDGKPTSFGIISQILRMAKATVAEHSGRYLAERRHGPRPPGRPSKFTRAIEEAIVVKAIDRFDSKTACAYSDLADFAFETFGVSVNSQLIRVTIKRNTDVKALLAYPMENDRVECPMEDIDARFALLEEELRQMPASLVCNLDEMGWAEYQDAQPITIVVPSYSPKSFHLRLTARGGASRSCIAFSLMGHTRLPDHYLAEDNQ
jgi:hypothetical protein